MLLRCVTGTPIEKSLDDLYGLLLFLQCDPYSVRHWFRRCLYEPYLRGRKVIMAESIISENRPSLPSVLCFMHQKET